MAKKAGSYRQIVSIPADLKKRMDKVADQVNWSAIAAAAFERKLGDFAEQKKDKNMQDVIQRLRGLKTEADGEHYTEGKQLGTAWAKDIATPAQLNRLHKAAYMVQEEDDLRPGSSAFSSAERFAFLFLDEDEQNRQGAREFWELLDIDVRTNDRIDDPSFLRGFVAGAQEIWNAVKDEI